MKTGTGRDGIPEDSLANSINPEVREAMNRRQFLKTAGLGGLGITSVVLVGGAAKGGLLTPEKEAYAAGLDVKGGVQTARRQVYVANAKGMVIGNPTRCVGCRRCELACTEFNDGKAQPSLARINVRRNWGFGPRGVQLGYWRGEGRFGNHRIIQDTCRQCPHPVPCQLSCPYDAVEVIAPLNARVINQEKCKGCGICVRACPWGMITFDHVLKKATKCHLCNGDPECVKACPASALQYVPWEDRTKEIPARIVVPAYIETPEDVKGTCVQCH